MEADVELDAWRVLWQARAPAVPDVKALVERETRRMRLFVAGEIAITIVFGGGSLAWAALSRRTDVLVLAIGVWLFIAIAWTLALLLRRGAWTPATATTTAYLDLAILRCRRRHEAVMAQAVLYAMILGFDLTWIYFSTPARGTLGPLAFLTSGGIAWVWAVTAALAVAAVRYRQKLARELEGLTGLRREIEAGPG
jgi:hypothetical protein